MQRLRHITTTLLAAAVLTIGTLQIAHARGMAPAVDEMVICAGHGIVTIGLDADGNPTGEIFYCPDCASTAIALSDVETPTPNAQILRFTLAHSDAPANLSPIFAPTSPPARGPPVFV